MNRRSLPATRVLFRTFPFLFAAASLAGQPGGASRVQVIDDFESGVSAAKWSGGVGLSRRHSSHGESAAQVQFNGRRTEITTTAVPRDWRGYDRLLFDIYCDRQTISTLTLQIYDDPEMKPGPKAARGYYEARNKIFIQNGWNHAEIRLGDLRTASYDRALNMGRIQGITLRAGRGAFPLTLYLDNFRLVAGVEQRETASRVQPQDTVTVINDRFFTVRQVARPEEVPEAPDVVVLRRDAEREAELLAKTIQTAQTQGIETIYAERHLVTADLGLHIRPRLAWFNNDDSKRAMFSYVAGVCRESRRELEDKIQGIVRLPAVDDTQVGEPLIRPFGHLKGRPIRDGFFVDDRGEPMMILSLHSPSRVLERFFATPMQHIESYSVGGGSRWTIEDSPVYAAFQQDPDTHRVGWDGWCGHLVRDLDSMGVSKMENTVICLESPRIRKAIEEYIRLNIPKFNANPELLYNIMAYELMYICYCDRSQRMFRDWLANKHGTIERANEKWGTSYKQFGDVVAPPVKNARPLAGTNRALWYDWARFNQDRFTDHLLWVRSVIRKIDPATPLAAGGSSSMLSGHTGTSGIDEERIVNEVDDLIIHEGGGSTMGMDLQLALSEKKKPLADPEMSMGSVKYLLPHILHGKSVAQLWHWPAQPANEFHSNTESSLAHGWMYPLPDIDELLRTALDVRRLNKEIAAFVDAPAEVAIFYSQTATLQLPPEMLTWETTPYLAELRKAYDASQFLDAKVTFITERKIRQGWLERYKLLLVPGVRNVPADVVAKIWDYVSRGGHVVITPESLLGDEYNHPAPYLSQLGIEIQETQMPKLTGGEDLVQGYDQSFSRRVVFADDTPIVLTPLAGNRLSAAGALRTRGIRQEIQADTKAQKLFAYPDARAAVIRVDRGKGAVYYSAASLENNAYSKLLDALFDEAGVARPVRVAALNSGAPGNIESRFAEAGNRKLLYVVNFGAGAARLRVKTAQGFFSGLRELRGETSSGGGAISVAAGETKIYEMF
jgi:hypothetical protein